MELYPVMINLAGRSVTVIGAGDVALRKAGDLLRCGARVHVIAPSLHEGFSGCAEEYGEQLVMTQREYCPGDITGSTLVIAATDNEAVNRAVFEEASKRSILINSADDPSNCSFFLPSSYRAGDLVMSISTGGSSPAMAARLRRELQKHIPGNIESILAALNEARQLLKSSESFSHCDTVRRGEIMKSIVNDDARLEALRTAYERGSLEACLLGFLNAC